MRTPRNTVQEPGNLRFDVLEQADAPNRFVLYEVYRNEEGMKAHKETPHYARWAEAVAPWMAEPRRGRQIHGDVSRRSTAMGNVFRTASVEGQLTVRPHSRIDHLRGTRAVSLRKPPIFFTDIVCCPTDSRNPNGLRGGCWKTICTILGRA